MKNIRYWLSILTGINFMKAREEPQKAPEHVREVGGKWVLAMNWPGTTIKTSCCCPSFAVAQASIPSFRTESGKFTLKKIEMDLQNKLPPRQVVIEPMPLSHCLSRRQAGYRVRVTIARIEAVYDGFSTREEAESAIQSCVNNMQEITLQEVADCLGEEVQVQIYQEEDRTDGQQGNRRNEPVYLQAGKGTEIFSGTGKVVSPIAGQ